MNSLNGPILIVEDVPNVLELLEVTLRFKGYAVVTARNGEEALEVIARQRPVLIITDILMPKMDGYAFVQKLRLNIETRAIPVVFLSATYVTSEDKDFALSLGAARFMEKPIDTEDFLLTVAELVNQQPFTQPHPLDMERFYIGYRTRLENKLPVLNGCSQHSPQTKNRPSNLCFSSLCVTGMPFRPNSTTFIKPSTN